MVTHSLFEKKKNNKKLIYSFSGEQKRNKKKFF